MDASVSAALTAGLTAFKDSALAAFADMVPIGIALFVGSAVFFWVWRRFMALAQ